MLQSTQSSATRPAQQLSQKSLIETNDGTRLFYQDLGAGQPVVFIHGWVVGADIWEYQMSDLPNHVRCIAYDCRGCGRSDQPSNGYDYDTLADDLAALLEQLDLQNVVLVAHSMGCGEVVRYLSRHGAARIDRVVLVATNTPFLLRMKDNPDGFDKQILDDTITELKRDRPRYLAAIAPTFFGTDLSTLSISPEMMQWGVGLALRASPKATIEMMRANFETDFRPDLHAVTVPTLIIHGDRDQSHPIDVTGRKTAQLIRGSQFKVYEGAAHGLFITHKEQFNRDLLAFI
ncbi:alpha/beta hydrolase [Leptolyngbya sp. NK1-12]|uniref:Alpha/beta hydrolase n=2 Tax=Leptolyngbya sp. NK1-12 TaxID=2547451 RepID=A0AA97AJM0_9CYAN|nr:alpha/beta hydrolase [Leptolyngbya sp. NK1-12]